MDRIERFRIFARVVECASFTRAAATLGLPRSSVSAAVADLEAGLGARLLNRTTRKVSTTQEGEAFYERCLRLLADVEEVENLFRHDGAGVAGRLRVDVPGRIGRLVIAPALPELLARHPALDVDLGVTDRAVNLVEDRVDCVLRVGPIEDSSLVGRRLGELGLVNVASPAYLAQRGVPRSPDDLSGHLAVNYASPSSGRVEDFEWVEGGERRALAMRARVTVNSAEAYIACALAGLGLIQIPAYDVRGHIASGELREVMPDHRAAPLPMSLLRLRSRRFSRRLEVFADWLEAVVRRDLTSSAHA
ncbi:LysR family transcriptional regulator [Methylocella sp.]|uniref:LysR family transcriptional regulator n=1 Tax=Methylocella sp. TaxID=1978226 RepID=UPI0035B205BE